MDFKFFGVVDIVLVLIMLISLILGFKKGFLKKAIGLVGILVALAVAVVFCRQLAEALKVNKVFYQIYTNVENNVISSMPNGADSSIKEVLVQIGIPDFLAGMFASNIAASTDASSIAANIAEFFYTVALVGISFVILFVGVFLVTIVLKIIASILRGNAIIRFVDGILGMALYFCLTMVFVYIVFAIMRAISNQEFFASCQNFLNVDMKLNEETFRLSKFFYNNNFIYGFFDLFF